MRPLRSIRWRLQLWYGLLFAALLAGFALLAYRLQRSVEFERIDGELDRLAFHLNGGLRGPAPRPPPEPGLVWAPAARPRPNPAEIFSREDEARGFYYAVWFKNGPRFAASANAPRDLPQPEGGERRGLRQRGPRREAFLSPAPEDCVLVGRSVEADLAELHRFAWKLTGGAAALLVGVLVIGRGLVMRALRPVQDITVAATRIATGDLARRIDTRDTDSELGQLAGVLNATFARLEAVFAQQGRFTADAAHELRTPVTVILTHTQNALAAPDLPVEVREALEASHRAAQRMRRLIDSLLQLARLDAGEEALRPAPLDLADVVREAVELIRPLAAERRLEVRAELAPARLRGDREQLAQVATNLLSNAVHHHGGGPGVIRVTTRREPGAAVLVVADDGPGVAPEDRPHLFERFYRAERARTGAGGRTGLGLAITKAIVDAHGGAIDVRTEPGAGAEFTVRLPARERVA